MNATRVVTLALSLSCLQVPAALGAPDDVEVHAYVNDACIVADEPFFVPAAPGQDNAKFLPLLGIVIGRLAEVFINHELQASANRIKSHAARKDTHYAMTRQMNLYRADLQPEPAVHLNAALGCMTVVAATFQPESTRCTAAYVPKVLAPETRNLPQSQWMTSRSDDSIENQLRRANVCVNGKARAVYEARFEFSDDGTAYRLKDAGYRIDSLLTTRDKGAVRNSLYTLKISNPGATEQQEVLSSAWVMLGSVTAGARSSGSGGESAPWLRVPPLSIEARRAYEEKTKTQQEVMGEIEALKRAMTRNQRMLAGLDQRIAAASGDVADGLKQERTRVAVQYQAQTVELEARKAEYQDLPQAPLEFMPVTIEVAVTETESEKKAQLALADLIGGNAGMVGSAVGNAATGLVSRSVKPSDIITEPDSPTGAAATDTAVASAGVASAAVANGSAGSAPARKVTTGNPRTGDTAELDRTRARYFDALAEVRTSPPSEVSEESKRNLVAAREQYNAIRRTLGLEQVK